MNKLLIFLIFMEGETLKNFFTARSRYWISRFTAEIKSPLVAAQIKKIPREKKEFGKTPIAHLQFTLEKGIKIIVMHVDPYYQSYLSIYENTLIHSGYPVILGQYPTLEKFSKYYKTKIVEKNVIQVQIKDGLLEDYALFTLREDHQIYQARYFENKIEIAKIIYEYKKYLEEGKSVLLPKKLEISIFHPKSESKEFFVELIPLQITFAKTDNK